MSGNDGADSRPAFDEFAGDYDGALNRGLSWTGETKEYFAAGRVKWLRRVLSEVGATKPVRVLDFGCGTGSSVPWLTAGLGCASYLGYDPSGDSVAAAAKLHGNMTVKFTRDSSEI